MTSSDRSRRLATILAADVVGYSRLMAHDEEGTVRMLKTHREVIDRLIARHDGRIFHTAGDSVLAEFGSAVEAVRCAITIQDELRARNAALDDARRMQFRIGVNLGDVIVDGDDLLGDGVNVAARLEGLAPPGGICISGATFEQVKNKLSVGFEDLGPQTVKNIPDPVAAFRITGAPVTVSESSGAAPAPGGRGRPFALAALVVGAAVAGWWLAGQNRQPPPASIATSTPPVAESPAPSREPVAPPTPAAPAAQAPAPAAAPPATVATTPPEPPSVTPVTPTSPAIPPAETPTPTPPVPAPLRAGDLSARLPGIVVRGVRALDGQPFGFAFHADGSATYALERPDPGRGTVLRATARWWAEDERVCVQVRGFNSGEPFCAGATAQGELFVFGRPDGKSLDWRVTRPASPPTDIVPDGPPDSSDAMRAPELRALVSGAALHATRSRDGRPFTVAFDPSGAAHLEIQNPKGQPFRETGRWSVEDYRFCMQFTRFNQGDPACPRFVPEGTRVRLTRGDGAPLDWTLAR